MTPLFRFIVHHLQICTVEDLLPMSGNIGVSVGAGVLFGLITTLVQHAGLFVLGFHSGLFGGISGIVISRLLGTTPASMWVCIGVFMGSGIVGSMANLYFQKGDYIFTTTTTISISIRDTMPSIAWIRAEHISNEITN